MPSTTSRRSISAPGVERLVAALFVVLLTAVASCGGPPDDDVPPEEAGPAAEEDVITPTDRALSLAQRLDEGLPFGAAQVRTAEVPGEEPRTVRLWRRDDRPVKLMSTEPDRRGRMIEHIAFYFDQGELFFVREPYERYIFRDGRLHLVLDDQLDTLAVRTEELVGRERDIVSRLERYMAPFQE